MPTAKAQAGFPTCIALSLEFNEHATYYMTVEQWIASEANYGRDVAWANDAERDQAIATDSVWTCQWHPHTPVGSCRLAASTFPALMAAIREARA